MGDTLLLGFGRHMIPIPRLIWHRIVSREARHVAAGLRFMSEEHHAVRNYVVGELPRSGEPLSVESIAERLGLPADKVRSILDDLEKHMTYVCRYGRTEVNWAYPVTVDETPHRVEYGTGERGFAA